MENMIYRGDGRGIYFNIDSHSKKKTDHGLETVLFSQWEFLYIETIEK